MNVPDLDIKPDGLVLITKLNVYTEKVGIVLGARYIAQRLSRSGVFVLNPKGEQIRLHSSAFEWCVPGDREVLAAKPLHVWKIDFESHWCALLTWDEVVETLAGNFEFHEPGDGKVMIDRVLMTQGEFANLGDFEGW